jgi:multidrug resistance efflux pump
MKTLQRLIRLHRHNVDTHRRAVRDLEAKEAEITDAIDALQKQILSEQILAAGLPDVVGAYGASANAAIERRRSLVSEQAAAREAVSDAREALRDAYAELKRFEISLSGKILAAQQDRSRREQAVLDEVASRLPRTPARF